MYIYKYKLLIVRPSSSIATPLGTYNPDWVVLIDVDGEDIDLCYLDLTDAVC